MDTHIDSGVNSRVTHLGTRASSPEPSRLLRITDWLRALATSVVCTLIMHPCKSLAWAETQMFAWGTSLQRTYKLVHPMRLLLKG